MRKKVDARVRTLVENGVALRHRSLFVIVGDAAREQVVNLHYMLSKAAGAHAHAAPPVARTSHGTPRRAPSIARPARPPRPAANLAVRARASPLSPLRPLVLQEGARLHLAPAQADEAHQEDGATCHSPAHPRQRSPTKYSAR